KRLAASGEDPAHFVEFLHPERVDLLGEPESLAQLTEGRRLLVLRHVGEAPELRCTFLGDGGCRVHAHRPMACRSYPYDRPDGRGALGLVPNYVCPDASGVLVTLRRSENTSGAPDPQVLEFSEAVKTRD